ncbi:hypothetical protein BDV93DRAFT_80081 [Ceratobasidium sp. AG-I]|nr:hypothetical protein BDV93DRAFT_80081 [Ceratobasidium sp. AG-I]
MAFQNHANVPPNIRHRIQDITIQPTISECPIKLEVLVDGQNVHKLSTIKPSQTLRWDMQTYPCDVHQGSTIGLKLIEKHHTSPDRELLIEYTVSEAVNQSVVTKHAGAFPSQWPAFGLVAKRPNTASATTPLVVTVKLLDLSQITSNYSNAFDRATTMVEETQGPLDKLGNSRETLKTILGFGAVVSELHPIAKLVIGLCTRAWELLEKIQKQHEDLERLINGLTQMRPFIDSLRKRAREAALEHVVFGLLKLIEDVANYIINSMHQTSAGRTKDGFSYTRESHRIGELLERLGDLKEQFDRGVGVQVLNQVLSTEQRALINQLKPNISFLNIMPSPCHEGTRTGVITDIRAWYLDTNNPQKLLWLYGQAGMGKSSIAASICQVFHDAGTLGAHFFFRRDDPHLRSPEHMFNFIVHRLALRYEPYGRAVATAIESYSGLLDMPLGQRYVHLVEHPLQSLVPTGESPSKTFVVIVDALDECENTDSRRSLFSYLRKMSQPVPWIKILITSRPDEDIEAAFDSTNYDHVASRNLTSYDTSSDILIYTRMRMADMANRKKRSQWPEDLVRELSMRAAGLFIWVETACKFIERGADMRKRLEQVLAGSQPTEGTAPLDLLYTTAIKHAMGDEGPDNVQIFRECIGAIVATGSHKPLPITGLESLLSDHVGAGVFHTVILSSTPVAQAASTLIHAIKTLC